MGLFGTGKTPKKRQRLEPQLFNERRSEPRQRKPVRRRSWAGWFFRLFLALGFWGAVAGVIGLGFVWFTLNQNGTFRIPEREPGIMILASDGTELAQRGKFFGDTVDLLSLPDYVPNAIVAIEDKRFYGHYGIDPYGLVRAMAANLRAGRLVQGGSTLTQQLAKNLFLSSARTLNRKAQEAVLAVWLERNFTKDEILQLYMNRVYFGGGANGIDQAARVFYSKSPEELSLMEAATLAAVLKAPTTYNPVKRPEDARQRAKLVLMNMVAQGYISEQEMLGALAEDTRVISSDYIPATQYAVDWISDQVQLLIPGTTESLVVETTIDTVMQLKAEASLRQRLAENAKALNVTQGAVVTLDAAGAVRAIVGGRSYKRSQFNRAVQAKRQPGSAFKPFVYLAAIENGYRPDSVEIDEPVTIGTWTPENYKRKYLGPVTLETAFALSLNTVAVKLGLAVTPQAIASVAHRFGITSELGNDASLSLGTSEVSLLELTGAFAPFANGGFAIEPHVITRITTRDGKVLFEGNPESAGSVISDTDLGYMNSLFRAVLREGTATKARFGAYDIGGKTGTSQNYRDAWFVGFTPYYVTGVWMGNDDNQPTKRVTGGSLPALVWKDIMEEAHKGLEPQALPGAIPSEGGGLIIADNDVYGAVEIDPEFAESELVAPAIRRKNRSLLESIFGAGEETPGIRRKPRFDVVTGERIN